jgi:vancomycin permeability regulator SanA
MRDIAYEREVARADIELDYEGYNTRQTILNLDASRSYLLVSNDFHLARINLLATQRGDLEFGIQGSDYLQERYTREPFFILRELVAFWYYALGG